MTLVWGLRLCVADEPRAGESPVTDSFNHLCTFKRPKVVT